MNTYLCLGFQSAVCVRKPFETSFIYRRFFHLDFPPFYFSILKMKLAFVWLLWDFTVFHFRPFGNNLVFPSHKENFGQDVLKHLHSTVCAYLSLLPHCANFLSRPLPWERCRLSVLMTFPSVAFQQITMKDTNFYIQFLFICNFKTITDINWLMQYLYFTSLNVIPYIFKIKAELCNFFYLNWSHSLILQW